MATLALVLHCCSRAGSRALSALFLLISSAAAGHAEEPVQQFRVLLAGLPAGCTRELERTTEQGQIRLVRRESRLHIRRGSDESLIHEWTTFDFGRDGAPDTLRALAVASGSDTVRVLCVVGRDSLRWEQTTGRSGRASRGPETRWGVAPLPEDFLLAGPNRARFARPGDDTLSWREFDASGLQMTASRAYCVGETLVARPGAAELERLHVWSRFSSALPGLETTEWRTAEGRRVFSSIPAWGLSEEAVEGEACPETGSADLFGAMRVELTSPWTARGRLSHVRYRLERVGGGPLALASPHDGRTSSVLADGSLDVSIEAPLDGTSGSAPPEECARPGRWIESDASEFSALVGLLSSETPRERALQLRDIVRDRISTKDLSVVFASAHETWESRRGDCTEHATLLAALLRAAGIPARLVAGFVPQGDALVWHVWDEAWIEERWIGLDAALDGPVDARYLGIAHSCLAGDGAPDLAYALAPFLGTLRAHVLSYE